MSMQSVADLDGRALQGQSQNNAGDMVHARMRAMKVADTGGTGLVDSHTVAALLAAGHDVRCWCSTARGDCSHVTAPFLPLPSGPGRHPADWGVNRCGARGRSV